MGNPKQIENIYLYTWNLKYHYLKLVFSILNNHSEFTTCTHKFKWLYHIEKPVLSAVFKLSDIQNQIIIRFDAARHRNAYLRPKIPLHTTRILDLKYALRCLAAPNQMLKYTLKKETSFCFFIGVCPGKWYTFPFK